MRVTLHLTTGEDVDLDLDMEQFMDLARVVDAPPPRPRS